MKVELLLTLNFCICLFLWLNFISLFPIIPTGGILFSIRGKVRLRRLMKSSLPPFRSVTLHPTSIPLRTFHAWMFRLERLATHLCCVSSSIARKKARARFLLKLIARKRKETIICDSVGRSAQLTWGKVVIWCRVWLYLLCSEIVEVSIGPIYLNNMTSAKEKDTKIFFST